jgi:hypothetical protein
MEVIERVLRSRLCAPRILVREFPIPEFPHLRIPADRGEERENLSC